MTKVKSLKRSKKNFGPDIQVKEFIGQSVDPNISYGDYGIPVPEHLTDMVDAYQLHPWVYSAVSVIAMHFASVRYSILLKPDEENEDINHPFQKILNQPNPFMTGYDLREATAISLEMTGTADWKIERNAQGVPVEAWPIPTHMIKAVATSTSPIDHFIYTVDGKMIRFDYEDVLHFNYHNPKNAVYGQGSALAARNEIAADLFASLWNKNFFINSGRPDAVIETDQTLSDEDRRRIALGWKQLHGGVKDAHKIAILEGGTKYKPISTSPKDMDFVTQRKYSREMILSVFNVPPALVGVLEFANYANMEQQLAMFWQMLASKVKKFEETISMRAEQMTFRPQSVIRANLQEVKALQPDFRTLSETVKNFVESGIPINDVIDGLGLPFDQVEGGDVPRGLQTTRVTDQNGIPGVDPNAEPAPAKAIEVKAVVPEDQKKALQREYRWKSFEQNIKNREDKFEGSLRTYFRSQKRRVQDNFKRHASTIVGAYINEPKGFLKTLGDEIMAKLLGDRKKNITVHVNLIFEEGKEQKIMEGIVARPITGTYFDFAIQNAKKVDPEFDFNMKDPVALHWIEHKKAKIVLEANAYTKEEISAAVVDGIDQALAEGFDSNETIAQIADRIDEVYQFAMEGRSTRIARTEIISASNAGAREGMKAAGATRKEWLSTNDNKTRESHQLMDGDQVGVDEAFVSPISGDSLQFPGDPNASPEEIVNCRCALIPVVDE